MSKVDRLTEILNKSKAIMKKTDVEYGSVNDSTNNFTVFFNNCRISKRNQTTYSFCFYPSCNRRIFCGGEICSQTISKSQAYFFFKS